MGETRTIDAQRFRKVLSHYPTGVCVITAAPVDGHPPAGMVVGTFTSVSLDPPLVAFLPDKSSTSWPRIRRTGAFCVNVLTSDQERLCRQFVQKGGDKFKGVNWRPAPTGSPILDGALAWIDCDIEQTFESGDHYIVVGRVRNLDLGDGGLPLAFFQGTYGLFAPGRPTSTDDSPTARKAVVDQILTDYLSGLLDRYESAVRSAAGPPEKLTALIRESFASIDDHRTAVILFQEERAHLHEESSKHVASIERAIQRLWTDVLQEGTRSGDFRADMEPGTVYRFIRDATFMAARWYRLGGRYSSAELAERYADLLLNGMHARGVPISVP